MPICSSPFPRVSLGPAKGGPLFGASQSYHRLGRAAFLSGAWILLQAHAVVGRIHLFAAEGRRSLSSHWLSPPRGPAVPSSRGQLLLQLAGTLQAPISNNHRSGSPSPLSYRCPNQGRGYPIICPDVTPHSREGIVQDENPDGWEFLRPS